MMLYFLGKLYMLENVLLFWRYFENFQCIDRMIYIRASLLQRPNGKRILNLKPQLDVCGKHGSKRVSIEAISNAIY